MNALGKCIYVDCREAATKVVQYPASVRGLAPIRNPYCDGHAALLLGDGFAFPGARDVTDEVRS